MIAGMGVHKYKGVGVRFALSHLSFYLIYHKYPMKMK